MLTRRQFLPFASVLLAVAALLAIGVQTRSASTYRAAGQPSAPSCQGSPGRQLFSEDFSAFNAADWTQGGSAAWASDTEDYYLTTTAPQLAGRLYYGTYLTGCGMRAEFDYTIGGGSGADGMTLAIVQDTDYDPAPGGGVDFCPGEDSIAAKFDTFINGGEPPGQHVAIITECSGTYLESALATVRGTHHVVVDFVEGEFTVYLDGASVVSYTVDDLDYFGGYIGVTAATGGSTDNHIVDDFKVTLINPLQGDFNCNGNVDELDALILLHAIESIDSQPDVNCPPLDTELFGGHVFEDANCDGAGDLTDLIAVLRFRAGLPLTVDACPAVGDAL